MQPIAVEKSSTLPRVLATRRPSTEEIMHLPAVFAAISAEVEVATVLPVSPVWLDKLEMSFESLSSTPTSRLDRVLGLWGPSDAAPLCCQAPMHDDLSVVVGGSILV